MQVWSRKITMSRRIKRTTSPGDRAKARAKARDSDRPKTGSAQRSRKADDRKAGDRPFAQRAPGKPKRFAEPRRERPEPMAAAPAKAASEQPLPTKVQTVVVTADENGMRVDRFLEARFPGLSFSHIQRIVRKGELRVNGKRADSRTGWRRGRACASRRCGSMPRRPLARCRRPRRRRCRR